MGIISSVRNKFRSTKTNEEGQDGRELADKMARDFSGKQEKKKFSFYRAVKSIPRYKYIQPESHITGGVYKNIQKKYSKTNVKQSSQVNKQLMAKLRLMKQIKQLERKGAVSQQYTQNIPQNYQSQAQGRQIQRQAIVNSPSQLPVFGEGLTPMLGQGVPLTGGFNLLRIGMPVNQMHANVNLNRGGNRRRKR